MTKEPSMRIYTRWYLTDVSNGDSWQYVSYNKVLDEISAITKTNLVKGDHRELLRLLTSHNLLLEWSVKEIPDYSGYNSPAEF
mgnify:CR=1 FL=1